MRLEALVSCKLSLDHRASADWLLRVVRFWHHDGEDDGEEDGMPDETRSIAVSDSSHRPTGLQKWSLVPWTRAFGRDLTSPPSASMVLRRPYLSTRRTLSGARMSVPSGIVSRIMTHISVD